MILRRLRLFCAATLMALVPGAIAAQTVALSDDPNFIHASLLIASPGVVPYHALGHAAIRMECPTHDLDRVFTFENNTDGQSMKLVSEDNRGKIVEIELEDYLQYYRDNGRQVKSYPLNLTLNEKARLWEVLDSLKTLPERPFHILDSHCFSEIAESLEIAVRPNNIYWDKPEMQSNSYHENALIFYKDNSSWFPLLITLPLGTKADAPSSGRQYVSPVGFEFMADELDITSPSGETRPLMAGKPTVILPKTNPDIDRPVRPTPLELGLLILGFVVVVTALQYFFRLNMLGKITDIVLWILVTVSGIFVAYITFMPGFISSGWNWNLIVLNPLAWLPPLIWRKDKQVLRCIWLIYAAVLIIYAGLIPLISPSVSLLVRLFAVALAIRCAFRASTRARLHSCKK